MTSSLNGAGRISREFTVWCGRCNRWDQTSDVNTVGAMKKWARRHGWKLTKGDGWVCPEDATKAVG